MAAEYGQLPTHLPGVIRANSGRRNKSAPIISPEAFRQNPLYLLHDNSAGLNSRHVAAKISSVGHGRHSRSASLGPMIRATAPIVTIVWVRMLINTCAITALAVAWSNLILCRSTHYFPFQSDIFRRQRTRFHAASLSQMRAQGGSPRAPRLNIFQIAHPSAKQSERAALKPLHQTAVKMHCSFVPRAGRREAIDRLSQSVLLRPPN
jgi:hypothetical protein